jgi:heparin/heparan-sulfate lyase
MLTAAASVTGAAAEPDLEWREFDGFAAPVPPPEHPRLYVRSRDIADLMRRTSHPALAAAWGKLQTMASGNAQRREELAALRFLMDRDPAPARAAVAEALDTLQKANYDPEVSDISRAIGRMMVTGAMVYDWCYPLLSDEQKQAFLAEFLRLAKQLECGYPPVDGGYVTGHTPEFMVMRDLLSAGIAIYDEAPEMYEVVAQRIFEGFLPVRQFWYEGQAFHQGAFYCDIRWAGDMFPLWIFDRMGAGNIFPPGQQSVPYEWIYRRRPDRQFLRAGDGYHKIPRLGMMLAASYYGDGYIWAEYAKDPGIDDENRIYEFLWRDPELGGADASELPLTR